MSRDFSFDRVASDEDRKLSLLKEPGVYAWYRDISSISPTGDPLELYEKIMTLLESPLSDVFEAQAGYLYKISVVENTRELSKSKSKLLWDILQLQEGRDFIFDHFRSMKGFLSPLYIGKAENIQERIGQHVKGESNLKGRLANAGIDLDACYVSVVYMNSIPGHASSKFNTKELAELLEDIVTRLGPSAFVRRPG